jgi:hypothetical protein
MPKLSEWHQSGSLKFPAKVIEIALERVEGIEPSYSAWKAAALPLSYTRVRRMTYHAASAASTSHGPVLGLNRPGIAAYIDVSINSERR